MRLLYKHVHAGSRIAKPPHRHPRAHLRPWVACQRRAGVSRAEAQAGPVGTPAPIVYRPDPVRTLGAPRPRPLWRAGQAPGLEGLGGARRCSEVLGGARRCWAAVAGGRRDGPYSPGTRALRMHARRVLSCGIITPVCGLIRHTTAQRCIIIKCVILLSLLRPGAERRDAGQGKSAQRPPRDGASCGLSERRAAGAETAAHRAARIRPRRAGRLAPPPTGAASRE
jgi:hypothetical protein